jgi:flagellar M-ring protein FliF
VQAKLRDFWLNTLDRWNQFERGQKIKIAVTVLVLLAALVATVFLTTRTRWVTLVNNKSVQEISLIENALNGEGLQSRLEDNSRAIAVREQDKDRAMVVVSQNPTLAGVDFTFEDALTASGMGSTERVKNEVFQRAFESELGQRLQLFEWVNQANVKIVFPDENRLFLQSNEKPSAAIWLVTNRSPDAAQAANVARLVSRAVKDLSMDDIEITDQNANTLYSGLQQSAGTTGSEQEVRRVRENELDARVRHVLLPIYDEVKTLPTLVFNWAETTTDRITHTSPNPDNAGEGVPGRRATESQNVEGATGGAEPGQLANDMTTATYAMGNQGTQSASAKSEDVDFIYDIEQVQTLDRIGDVVLANSSMGVWVYKHKHYYQHTMEQNGQLGNLTWEEFKDETARVETRIDVDQDTITALRMATGLTALSVIGYEVPVFHDYDAPATRWQEFIIFGILALLILLLALGLLRRSQADEIIELEPELTVEDLLVSTQLEEEKEDAVEIEPLGVVTESETISQIGKFIDERPDVVAALLRNWLNEEWE